MTKWPMISLIKNRDFYGMGLFLLLVVMIGYQRFISPAIGVFFLIFLTEVFVAKTLRFKLNWITTLFVLLFVYYLFGLMWSDHRQIGWKLLEYKMSFFIFPILLYWYKDKTNIWLVLQGLVWGSLLLSCRFFYAIYADGYQDLSYYELSRQVIQLHPTYASVYLTVTSVYLVYAALQKKAVMPHYFAALLVLLFSFLVVAIGSFAAILFLALCVAIGLLLLVRYFLGWLGVVIAGCIVPVVFYFSITKPDRLKYDMEMLQLVRTDMLMGKAYFIEKNKAMPSGTVQRMLLWYISLEIIAENPWGTGTGDIDFHLAEKADKYGLVYLKEESKNPHNQFLQIGIDLGIPGILLLVFILSIWIFEAFKTRNYFLLLVTCCLLFNAMFESVLQRQSGIVFFTSLLCLSLVYGPQLKSREFGRRGQLKTFQG